MGGICKTVKESAAHKRSQTAPALFSRERCKDGDGRAGKDNDPRAS